MKRKLTQLSLTILAGLPLASVATAAQAKRSDLEGDDQNQILKEYSRTVRNKIFNPDETFVTVEEARKRYAEVTGLNGEELEINLIQDIEKLVNFGLIKMDEKFIVSAGPSEH